MLQKSLWVHDLPRFLQCTYILDIIRSYCLVVAIYGTLSYNNNVQPFLISTVLEGYKEAKAFENMTENILHCQKLDPVMEDNYWSISLMNRTFTWLSFFSRNLPHCGKVSYLQLAVPVCFPRGMLAMQRNWRTIIIQPNLTDRPMFEVNATLIYQHTGRLDVWAHS